ncbi:hypothetical protein F2P81_017907 [Scophthalmus maximus]|uniref:Uncharacterized protein n=1 Tax=Scophthalmus maximus TaxID=52904 RepID=A0A6A4SE30_SCOMX|nr:hypothetical protein F2P81_017907 [Scophthalmus maximus]
MYYLATRRRALGRRASILALYFILVTRKSPDRKQEVSTRIKCKKFTFCLRLEEAKAPMGRKIVANAENKAAEPRQRSRTDAASFFLVDTKHGAGDCFLRLSFYRCSLSDANS